MDTEEIHFSGTITKVTPDGRPGVVCLDQEIGGNAFAVISPETQGGISLMNGHGALSMGTLVEGEAVKGVDALIAIRINTAE